MSKPEQSRRGPARAFAAWAVIVLSLAAARSRAEDAPLKADDAPLLDRVLKLNRVQEPELDLDAARKAFAEVCDRARAALADAKTAAEKVTALNKALLTDRNVTYLSNLYWRDATLAASLLRSRGNCLSTSTLYVLVGEELKLPVRMVVVPRHAFARWDDGQTRINIETTRKGSEIPDRVYLYQIGQATPEDVEALGWGRSLSRDEFLAELTDAAAMHAYSDGRVDEALKLFTEADRLVPGRTDRKLTHIRLMADATKDRASAARAVKTLIEEEDLPPSVLTSGLLYLADDAASRRDFAAQRQMLLAAFARAPKSSEPAVLQRLAFCHRSLKDFRGASRYMELAVSLTPPGSPQLADDLYNLSILQKNDGRLDDALRSIRAALKMNPESWNLRMIEAGYMVLAGEREEGIRRFEAIARPRGDLEFYESMLAWFYAVSRQREKFYPQFEKALTIANSPHVLVWIEQDVDLDVYREEPEFKALVEKHRKRLMGGEPGEAAPGGAARERRPAAVAP